MLCVASSHATDGRCGVFGRVVLALGTSITAKDDDIFHIAPDKMALPSYGCWQEIASAPVLDTKGEVSGRTLLFSWEPGRMVSLVQTVYYNL